MTRYGFREECLDDVFEFVTAAAERTSIYGRA